MIPSEKLIYDYFRDFAMRRPDDVFIFDEACSYTVSQTFRIIKNMSAQLKGAGVGTGEEVRLSASRDVRTILCFFALQFMGASAILIDPRDEAGTARCIKKMAYYMPMNAKYSSNSMTTRATFCPRATAERPR